MNNRTVRSSRRKVAFASTVLLLAPLLLSLQATPAAACQCIAQISVQHLARADAVFTGRLVGIDGLAPTGAYWSSIDPVTYRFDVERVLKGAVPRDASVRSVVSGASCGLEGMHQGEWYTVFAETVDDSLRAGLCGGTHAGDPDPAIALVSGALLAPAPGAPSWSVLLAIPLAVIVGAMVWRRRSQRGRSGDAAPGAPT